MPDCENCRIAARVPTWIGALSSLIDSLTSAWPSSVMVMSSTDPTATPPTCTGFPLTSWPPFWKVAVTL
jgi:hypothetical protein